MPFSSNPSIQVYIFAQRHRCKAVIPSHIRLKFYFAIKFFLVCQKEEKHSEMDAD